MAENVKVLILEQLLLIRQDLRELEARMKALQARMDRRSKMNLEGKP
jgi:hypothetical protein